ncbi:hypothetical protein SLEP1_g30341 [Rubroshorea leprosula]|uniref:RRM domain-containing protein n=1 Tax=Rubroshorea leprosula TaxID=152421 RepID=A0AAV5K886_9ROSI|nr:hypothetical protein SLEP1_g30341 [Rubroshorea leprosula]
MWHTFSRFGRVLEVYILEKRDKYGRRFGFVRFQDIRDTKCLEVDLDQIKVGEVKIHVNQLRFRWQTRGHDLEHHNKDIRVAFSDVTRRAGVSYAEVVKGKEVKGQGFGNVVKKGEESN